MTRPVPPARLSVAQRIALHLAPARLVGEVKASRELAIETYGRAIADETSITTIEAAYRALRRYQTALDRLSALYLDVAPQHYAPTVRGVRCN